MGNRKSSPRLATTSVRDAVTLHYHQYHNGIYLHVLKQIQTVAILC